MNLLERQILTRFQLFFILQKVKNSLYILLITFGLFINGLADAEEEIEENCLATLE